MPYSPGSLSLSEGYWETIKGLLSRETKRSDLPLCTITRRLENGLEEVRLWQRDQLS